MIIPAAVPLASLAVSGASSLVGGAVAATDKVASTARDFESMLMSEVVKQMRQPVEPGGGLFPNDSADVYGGLFDFFMGKHLADSGGLGLADSLRQRLQVNTPR